MSDVVKKQDNEEILDAVHLAKFLKIDRTSVFRFVRQGKLPKPIKLGRSARWKMSTIMNWLDQREAMAR